MRQAHLWTTIAASAALVGTGCGPWVTQIPTYWPPVLRKPRPVPEARRPPPPPPPAPAPPPPPKVAVKPRAPVKKPAPDTELHRTACMAIYVVTSGAGLHAFHPAEGRFERRGALRCPTRPWETPFSMAVARDGRARVVYTSGELFEVGLRDAACRRTSYQPNPPPGFKVFGMGYAPDGEGETLYVAEASFRAPSLGLAAIDTRNYKLRYIGPFSENPGLALELTPTGDGPLYGYFINRFKPGGTLVKIDTKNARILESTPLSVGTRSSSLAVAWWGGAFYIFTTFALGTEVNRYDPATKRVERVATFRQRVVGAGVSTCAPPSATR